MDPVKRERAASAWFQLWAYPDYGEGLIWQVGDYTVALHVDRDVVGLIASDVDPSIDIHVVVDYRINGKIKPLGWITRSDVEKRGSKLIPVGTLRPIHELKVGLGIINGGRMTSLPTLRRALL